IERCREAASFERLSGGRKPGEEKPQAFMRKGAVGDWRNHFDDRARDIFERSAGPLLRRMGYDEGRDPAP
ncbi:MAG: sulfotransferase domain-containing protein, partial [Dongiaceae bacterium]